VNLGKFFGIKSGFITISEFLPVFALVFYSSSRLTFLFECPFKRSVSYDYFINAIVDFLGEMHAPKDTDLYRVCGKVFDDFELWLVILESAFFTSDASFS
jgi:hypothetical protein